MSMWQHIKCGRNSKTGLSVSPVVFSCIVWVEVSAGLLWTCLPVEYHRYAVTNVVSFGNS